jgi:DNA repair protein RecO (recombination protein O)
MLSKTGGIVLQTIKHSDSGLICHILTEEYGLIPFMVRGTHSKKSSTRIAYFQPLQVLSLEIYYKPSRNIQSLKEVSSEITLKRLHFDFERNCIAFFIGEVLKKTLNEGEPNEGLYSYIKEGIIHLDTDKNILNFHIGFLIGLMKYLGIAPTHEYSEKNCFFDMQNGLYTDSPPLHGYYFDKKFSELLHRFSGTSIEECSSIALSGNIRSLFIDNLISYFSMHLQGLNRIRSFDVLKEIFKQ